MNKQKTNFFDKWINKMITQIKRNMMTPKTTEWNFRDFNSKDDPCQVNLLAMVASIYAAHVEQDANNFIVKRFEQMYDYLFDLPSADKVFEWFKYNVEGKDKNLDQVNDYLIMFPLAIDSETKVQVTPENYMSKITTIDND